MSLFFKHLQKALGIKYNKVRNLVSKSQMTQQNIYAQTYRDKCSQICQI